MSEIKRPPLKLFKGLAPDVAREGIDWLERNICALPLDERGRLPSDRHDDLRRAAIEFKTDGYPRIAAIFADRTSALPGGRGKLPLPLANKSIAALIDDHGFSLNVWRVKRKDGGMLMRVVAEISTVVDLGNGLVFEVPSQCARDYPTGTRHVQLKTPLYFYFRFPDEDSRRRSDGGRLRVETTGLDPMVTAQYAFREWPDPATPKSGELSQALDDTIEFIRECAVARSSDGALDPLWENVAAVCNRRVTDETRDKYVRIFAHAPERVKDKYPQLRARIFAREIA